MKSFIKVIIFLSLYLLTCNIYAQSDQSDGPFFTGIIHQDEKLKNCRDTIVIVYCKPYTPKRTNYQSIDIITNKDGLFKFRLPKYSEPAVMGIWVMHNGRGNSDMSKKQYYFQSGDNINIEIIKHNNGGSFEINFSGLGAEKYKIVEQLNNLGSPASGKTELRTALAKLELQNPIHIKNKIRAFNELVIKLDQKKRNIIENSGLDPLMQQIITYEYAPIFSDWKFMIFNYFTRTYKDNAKVKLLLKQSFNQYKKKFNYGYSQIMSLCPEYLDFLACEESYNLFINSNNGQISITDLYNRIITKFDGMIRERLIANLFLGFSGYITQMEVEDRMLDSLMKDGEQYIKTPFVKEIYSSQMKLSKGNDVFNASFKDLNNQDISLSSLKGKVVLIDLWFTGCGACSAFYQNFHQNFYPLLSSNRDFVYLSINIDPKMKTWKESIKSGKYTAQQYLNVYTNELGTNHPFYKYYNIGGAPFLLIIDKNGKIASNVIKGPEGAFSEIKQTLNLSEGI